MNAYSLRIRRVSQLVGLLAANSYFNVLRTKIIYQGDLKGICLPLLNCYACPLATFSCPIRTKAVDLGA
jgi:hypothetical protein